MNTSSRKEALKQKFERSLNQKREKEYRERDAAKKRRQRQNYIVGEIVIDRFPDIESLDPGRHYHYQDIESFAAVVKFLDLIASDEDNMAIFKKCMSDASIIPECVSGHSTQDDT